VLTFAAAVDTDEACGAVFGAEGAAVGEGVGGACLWGAAVAGGGGGGGGGGAPPVGEGGGEGGGGGGGAPARAHAHVLRPLRWRDNAVALVATVGDDVLLATEAHHARVLSAAAEAWRRAGLRCGDAGGPYAYGVHWGSGGGGGGAPALRQPLAPASPLAPGGGGALGLLLAPPRGACVAELLGEEGGAHALQRFLFADSVTARAAGGGAGGQYALVVATLFHSVVAAAAGAWAAALGPRAPADVMLSPSGHLFLCGLYFSGGAPDEALQRVEGDGEAEEDGEGGGGGAAAGPAPPPFATPPLRRALYEALGVGGAGDNAQRAALVAAVVDAIMALRRDAAALVALYGGALVRGAPRAAHKKHNPAHAHALPSRARNRPLPPARSRSRYRAPPQRTTWGASARACCCTCPQQRRGGA
jgi:hypothetical protein